MSLDPYQLWALLLEVLGEFWNAPASLYDFITGLFKVHYKQLTVLFLFYFFFSWVYQACFLRLKRRGNTECSLKETPSVGIVDDIVLYLNRDTENGKNIAIAGAWGSGKTWIASRVAQHADVTDKFQVYTIRCSVAESHRDVIEEIILKIKLCSSHWFWRIGIWVREKFISVISAISLGGAYVDVALSVNRPPSKDGNLSAYAQNLEKPLLFIVDDIDRMKPDEIPLFLALFEEVSRLKNIDFLLLFNEDVLRKSIGVYYDAWGDKDGFSWKMIDKKFETFQPDFEERKKFLFERLGADLTEEIETAISSKTHLLPRNHRYLEKLAESLRQFSPPQRGGIESIIIYKIIEILNKNVAKKLLDFSQKHIDATTPDDMLNLDARRKSLKRELITEIGEENSSLINYFLSGKENRINGICIIAEYENEERRRVSA